MRYLIDAWLEEGDPRLKITDADSGSVRLQWIYRRSPSRSDRNHDCLEGPPCAGCSALHCLLSDLFLLACADRLSSCMESARAAASNESEYREQEAPTTQRDVMPGRRASES